MDSREFFELGGATNCECPGSFDEQTGNAAMEAGRTDSATAAFVRSSQQEEATCTVLNALGNACDRRASTQPDANVCVGTSDGLQAEEFGHEGDGQRGVDAIPSSSSSSSACSYAQSMHSKQTCGPAEVAAEERCLEDGLNSTEAINVGARPPALEQPDSLLCLPITVGSDHSSNGQHVNANSGVASIESNSQRSSKALDVTVQSHQDPVASSHVPGVFGADATGGHVDPRNDAYSVPSSQGNDGSDTSTVRGHSFITSPFQETVQGLEATATDSRPRGLSEQFLTNYTAACLDQHDTRANSDEWSESYSRSGHMSCEQTASDLDYQAADQPTPASASCNSSGEGETDNDEPQPSNIEHTASGAE
jgi:hypothetical protein